MSHDNGGSTTRRRFLAGTAGATLAGWAISQARAQGANERIQLGIIGCGGRGTNHMEEIEKLMDSHAVEITAICDVWRPNREKAVARVREKTGKEPFSTTKFEELLSRADVDGVVIATPDHAHCPILTASARSKKDAYCEKPMSRTLEEAVLAFDTVKENKTVVQIGTQRRSEGPFKAAAELMQTGVMGTITEIDTAWHDSGPRWARPFDDVREEDVDWEQYRMGQSDRPFDARRYRCWHLFRDYTCGLPGLLGSHLVDVALWFMDDPFPVYGTALGGIYIWKDGREHCDTIECLYEYPKGFLLRYSNRLGNVRPTPEITVYGSRGSFDTSIWKVVPDGGGKDKVAEAIKVIEKPSDNHMGNFLDCMRSRATTNAPIDAGYAHSVAATLASESQRLGVQLAYDQDKRTFKPMGSNAKT